MSVDTSTRADDKDAVKNTLTTDMSTGVRQVQAKVDQQGEVVTLTVSRVNLDSLFQTGSMEERMTRIEKLFHQESSTTRTALEGLRSDVDDLVEATQKEVDAMLEGLEEDPPSDDGSVRV